jgi:hypothetical protein
MKNPDVIDVTPDRPSDRRRGIEALRAIGSSLVLVIVAAAFLLHLDWSRVWPVFLILAGVSMLLPKREAETR